MRIKKVDKNEPVTRNVKTKHALLTCELPHPVPAKTKHRSTRLLRYAAAENLRRAAMQRPDKLQSAEERHVQKLALHRPMSARMPDGSL